MTHRSFFDDPMPVKNFFLNQCTAIPGHSIKLHFVRNMKTIGSCLNCNYMYTLGKRSWGVYWGMSVRLPIPAGGHDLRNGCLAMDFSENVYTHDSTSEEVHLELSYRLDNFSLFYSLFWTLTFLKQEILSKKFEEFKAFKHIPLTIL